MTRFRITQTDKNGIRQAGQGEPILAATPAEAIALFLYRAGKAGWSYYDDGGWEAHPVAPTPLDTMRAGARLAVTIHVLRTDGGFWWELRTTGGDYLTDSGIVSPRPFADAAAAYAAACAAAAVYMTPVA